MFWQNLYNAIYTTVETPAVFGSFHIISLALVILTTVVAVLALKNAPEKSFRRFVSIVWCILVLGEIYREICFSLSLNDGVFTWDYAWYQFPFQLCASPLYAFPVVALIKDGKVRDGFLCFLSLWCFFGGAAVMIYPGDVLCQFLGINIQSLIHHGAQVVVGVLVAVRNYKKMDAKYFFKGFCVYLGFLAVAMILNVTVHHYLVSNGMNDTFNMFFISPYHQCTLPILSEIHAATSWGVLFPLYVFGFIVIALIIFFVQRALCRAFRKA